MKKVYLLALCLMAAVAVNAQGIGIKAGINLANVKMEDESGDMKLGFHFGVVNEFELSESLFFTPGLIYSQKGVAYEEEEGKMKITVSYLELPLDLTYKADLGGAKFYVAAGPYLAYELGSKIKIGDFSIDGDAFGEDDSKKLDFGINAGLGVEISSIRIGAQYGLGLANLSGEEDFKMKNSAIGISVGYFFGR